MDKKKRYKPLFIGNSAIDRAPHERPNPFGDSWQASAALADVAGVLSEDLYRPSS